MAKESNKNQKVTAAFPNQINKQGTTGLQICNTDGNPMFDMTAMLSAAQTYNRLNTAINKLIGYEVRWFRAVPQQRSQDVIFQEYTLSCVEEEPVCLKVVLPDGNFPDSKYNYDLMGLEYEVPLEVHIDKVYWESMAGGGTAPQKKDIVYFSTPNKLYEVVSSYLFRGFMEQETTWKVNLRKYQPQASRKEGDALKKTIDDYTVSAEELLGEKIESDIKKLQDDKQMSPFNSTEKDLYKILDPSLYIVPSRIEMYGTLISESYYDLSSSKYNNAIVYNSSDNLTTSDNRCITAWTMIDPGVQNEYEVESITRNLTIRANANYELKIKSRINTRLKTLPMEGDNLEISRPGALNFYATVVDTSINDSGQGSYYVKIDDTVVSHLNNIKSNWTTAKNYKMKQQDAVSILDGINSNYDNLTGFKVNIHSNQYIKITYGTQEHVAVMEDRLNNKEWYGIVVNIGNTWGQYNTYIYRQHPNDSTTKLQNIFYQTIDFTPEITYVEYYAVNKSPSYLTNLRLYVQTMEEEKHIEELLSYFVKDGDQLRIGDNADRKLRAPYTGKQR